MVSPFILRKRVSRRQNFKGFVHRITGRTLDTVREINVTEPSFQDDDCVGVSALVWGNDLKLHRHQQSGGGFGIIKGFTTRPFCLVPDGDLPNSRNTGSDRSKYFYRIEG